MSEAGSTSGTPTMSPVTGAVQLSDEGHEQHARISAEVRAMRTAVTDGLSEEGYRAVVTGRAQIAANLERRLAY